MTKKRKNYLIISIHECDKCGTSSLIARVKPSRDWIRGPRCNCGALGDTFQWSIVGNVKATGQFNALESYRIGKKAATRILILEDDPERHLAFEAKFGGYDITIVETAQEAIQRLREAVWDVLFLDHDLGGQIMVESGPGTGYEVAVWLEEHKDQQPKQIFLHTYNPIGAEKMKAAIPNAILAPGIWLEGEDLV
jgi:CheY-like chemotaxis protein